MTIEELNEIEETYMDDIGGIMITWSGYFLYKRITEE